MKNLRMRSLDLNFENNQNKKTPPSSELGREAFLI
jgi:hypothetical protein